MNDLANKPDLGMVACSCGGIPQRLHILLPAQKMKLYGFVCTKCGRRCQPAAYPTVAKENWNRMVKTW